MISTTWSVTSLCLSIRMKWSYTVFLSNALFGIDSPWLVLLLEPSPRDKSPWQFHYVWAVGGIQMPGVPWSQRCLVCPDCRQQLPAAGRWGSLISPRFTGVQRENTLGFWFSYCLWLDWGDTRLASNCPVLTLRLLILLLFRLWKEALTGGAWRTLQAAWMRGWPLPHLLETWKKNRKPRL